MAEKTRWGIIGPGGIARRFAEAVGNVKEATLMAVGSRSKERAEAFGNDFNIPKRFDSYEAMVADPEVDAVYVATPHSKHKDAILLAIKAGKATLCEKPLTVNAKEADTVIAAARQAKVFLMEAMWTRFLPTIVKVRELVADGAIGDILMVKADFGFRGGVDPNHRLFNPELAGGGLLDVGVYSISFAQMLLGEPEEVTGFAHIGETGVDEHCALVLKHAQDKLSMMAAGVRIQTPYDAWVLGTEGQLYLDPRWYGGTGLTLKQPRKDDQRFELPFDGNGFENQIREVHACLAAGKTESDIMPLDESAAIMRTADRARAQWGLVYPFEQ